MVMDWLTAAGIVSALAAVVGYDIFARRGNQTKQSPGKALPPRFRALAAGDFHDDLKFPCRDDLPGTGVPTRKGTHREILVDD